MSFFKKLKNKMFKSSSKLEEGLDAIVEDGGAAEDISADPIVASEPKQDLPQPTHGRDETAEPESVTSSPQAPVTPAQAPQDTSAGMFGRILGGKGTSVVRRELDDEMLESLEELL
ncbi:MAG: hypothetical protein ABJQ14_09110, partial [Hyphomicrobiales bacterium]